MVNPMNGRWVDVRPRHSPVAEEGLAASEAHNMRGAMGDLSAAVH